MRSFARLFACALVCIPVLSSGAATTGRPYQASGTARFTSPNFDFAGSGQATHLGRYSETGQVSFTPSGTAGILNLEATAVYTAANGDQLRASIAGELNQGTGAIDATVTYVGGTGRFANASGSAELAGQFLPDETIAVNVGGNLNF